MAQAFGLSMLPDELLIDVLKHLDVPDLLNVSRTCHHLRSLSLDPVLHSHRLHVASCRLSVTLPHRPSLSSLAPPVAAIYLTATHVLARHLSRRLVAIRLSRNLARRPSVSSLVGNNILPEECCRCDKATGAIIWGGGVAPSLVGAKRKVERERVKDGLRAWLERKAQKVELLQSRERLTVRGLVQRFTPSRRSGAPSAIGWGAGAATGKEKTGLEQPPRAHVLGLRRFWEGVATMQGERCEGWPRRSATAMPLR